MHFPCLPCPRPLGVGQGYSDPAHRLETAGGWDFEGLIGISSPLFPPDLFLIGFLPGRLMGWDGSLLLLTPPRSSFSTKASHGVGAGRWPAAGHPHPTPQRATRWPWLWDQDLLLLRKQIRNLGIKIKYVQRKQVILRVKHRPRD